MLNENEKLYFWSGIMKDHAEFFLMNLSSREEEFINTAEYFKLQFTEIQDASRNPINDQFIDRVMNLLGEFIQFKQFILRRLLTCSIEISLPSSFINHMINEAMEFFTDLNKIKRPVTIDPIRENINLHKIWLPDAAGHAASIAADLDPVEKEHIKEAEEFEKDFNCLFIKADELGKMLERTELTNGVLDYLNEQAFNKITEFIDYLGRIKNLVSQCKLLGVLKPIIPDHMIREEQYYLDNIESFKR
jgi:hypothetical protein